MATTKRPAAEGIANTATNHVTVNIESAHERVQEKETIPLEILPTTRPIQRPSYHGGITCNFNWEQEGEGISSGNYATIRPKDKSYYADIISELELKYQKENIPAESYPPIYQRHESSYYDGNGYETIPYSNNPINCWNDVPTHIAKDSGYGTISSGNYTNDSSLQNSASYVGECSNGHGTIPMQSRTQNTHRCNNKDSHDLAMECSGCNTELHYASVALVSSPTPRRTLHGHNEHHYASLEFSVPMESSVLPKVHDDNTSTAAKTHEYANIREKSSKLEHHNTLKSIKAVESNITAAAKSPIYATIDEKSIFHPENNQFLANKSQNFPINSSTSFKVAENPRKNLKQRIRGSTRIPVYARIVKKPKANDLKTRNKIIRKPSKVLDGNSTVVKIPMQAKSINKSKVLNPRILERNHETFIIQKVFIRKP